MAKIQPASTILDTHSAKSAARISGLTLDMVNYLCRHEFVTPSGARNRGHGVARKYTYTDVLLLRVMAKILSQGISVKNLGKSLASLQRRGRLTSGLIAKKYILTDGSKIFVGDNATLELLDSGQMTFAFVLELGSVRKEVDVKIINARKVASGNQ